MSNWPRWRRAGQPGALAQYVLPSVGGVFEVVEFP